MSCPFSRSAIPNTGYSFTVTLPIGFVQVCKNAYLYTNFVQIQAVDVAYYWYRIPTCFRFPLNPRGVYLLESNSFVSHAWAFEEKVNASAVVFEYLKGLPRRM